jgi:hypothetical protein
MRLWFERGFIKKPKTYELQKMFPGHAFLGYSGSIIEDPDRANNDMTLLAKFYKKYPEVKYFPSPSRLSMGFGGSV